MAVNFAKLPEFGEKAAVLGNGARRADPAV
jgi:hypothetical protein